MIGGTDKQWRLMAVVFYVGLVTTGLLLLGVATGLGYLIVRGVKSLL